MKKLPTRLNNVLSQLFDHIESECKITFAEFARKTTAEPERNIINKDQKYLQQARSKQQSDTEKYSNETYKYLYDPSLAFDFRFHQRLAQIKYEERKEPWVTLIFNTQQINEPTRVNTHMIDDVVVASDGSWYEYTTKKVTVPVNMVLISNDMTYLNGVQEQMLMYFDRFISFQYKESVIFNENFTANWLRYGHASNIRQINLTKLDTEARGSLTQVAWSFNLVYYVTGTPNGTPLSILERVDMKIMTRDGQEAISFTVT